MSAIRIISLLLGTTFNVQGGPLEVSIETGLEEWEKMRESVNARYADADILSVGFQAIAGPANPYFSWSIDLVHYNRVDDIGKSFLYVTRGDMNFWTSGGFGGGIGISIGLLVTMATLITVL